MQITIHVRHFYARDQYVLVSSISLLTVFSEVTCFTAVIIGGLECGGVLNESSGSIQSALYPDYYHNNANCTWIIRVPEQKLISIR